MKVSVRPSTKYFSVQIYEPILVGTSSVPDPGLCESVQRPSNKPRPKIFLPFKIFRSVPSILDMKIATQ